MKAKGPQMLLKWLIALLLCFAAATESLAAGTGACLLPQGLDNDLAKRFPGAQVVRFADLGAYEKKLYKKDFGSRCPGVVKVNFYGDGKPTWAVVLISGENPKRKAEVIVVRKLDSGWDIRSLEATDGEPVVWREGPGKYEDVYGQKTIQATRPVVLLSDYGSYTIVYAWNDKEVEKVWLSD